MSTKPSPLKKRLLIFLQIFWGLCLGLLAAEVLFWYSDDGAFPHVNFYQKDPALGVRLTPGATERFRTPPNPATSIRVNSEGYRGADFGPRRKGEIIVVGDSQVFGLGVEEQQTFSAQLGKFTRKPVINGGVPTYGPQEYLMVAEELLKSRRPEFLVFTVNYANDAFEISRPNKERHKVWDGWAVRIETAPRSVVNFPGRSLLFTHSHLVFALRRLWFQLSSSPEKRRSPNLPSEGNWGDLVPTEHLTAGFRVKENLAGLDDLQESLEESRRSPRDIVSSRRSEAVREEEYTAAQIDRAAKELRGINKKLKHLKAQRKSLRNNLAYKALKGSVFDGTLRELNALCAKYGAKPILLILPLDIQISHKEWEKYNVKKPVYLGHTLILLENLGRSAVSHNIPVMNASRTLQRAQPGAFLDRDLHMTPKGHTAVARSLARLINKHAAPHD